jgi:hypothetical protein
VSGSYPPIKGEGTAVVIRHPEISYSETVRISSFRYFLNKHFKGWDSHVAKYAPQND